jgi:hypothetical protein
LIHFLLVCVSKQFSRGAFFAEQSKQAGSCALPQAIENAGPCAVEGALVLKYVVVPVRRVP